MAHDVFISYSSKDKTTADAVVATLESREVRCWVAPRDILPGVEYAEALVDALHGSRLMVLVFSSDSNQSHHVLREVERAVSQGIPILPLRIENVPPCRAMEYYISSRHWLDALNPPLERHLEHLAGTAKLLLSRETGDSSSATLANAASQPKSSGRPASAEDAGFPASEGLRLGHAMAGGAALPRVDGHSAFFEAVHSMAAAVQQFDGWLRASQRVRAAFRERPKTAVGILAMASMLVAFIAAWMVQTSNPLYRAERALASGRAEAALRHLEGVTNSAKAGFLRGRALYSLKRASEGIAQYKEASLTEPEVLAHKEVLSDLAQSLGGRQSQDAVELLVQAGEPAVELLVDASRDTQNSRRRWAAIEGLRRMKHEDRVDLVAAYLLDIKSRDCAVVTKAAKSLGELGDKRAVQPLREIAQRKSLVFDACEAPAARAALRRLEKK